MKRILYLILIFVFLTGCGITGKVVDKIDRQPTQEEKELIDLENALAENDVSICYGLENQPVREVCFISLARELKDPSVCNNLLSGSLRDSCKAGLD